MDFGEKAFKKFKKRATALAQTMVEHSVIFFFIIDLQYVYLLFLTFYFFCSQVQLAGTGKQKRKRMQQRNKGKGELDDDNILEIHKKMDIAKLTVTFACFAILLRMYDILLAGCVLCRMLGVVSR